MYNIFFINTPSDSRAEKLRQSLDIAVEDLMLSIVFHDGVAITDGIDASSVAIYFGNSNIVNDSACSSYTEIALAHGVPLIPVIDDETLRKQQTHQDLSLLKSMTWSTDDAVPDELTSTILEVLGITEQDRKVFISYRQSDASAVAGQLHHALAENRFDIYLDRFQSAVGDNIQEQIGEALEDMAFVLLLHSPEMHESQWVDIEITHALKSGLPIIVLKWNTTTTEIPKINRFPTIDFNPDIDMRNGLIQASKLDEITQLVESAHADGIYRRRRESVEAVRQRVMIESGVQRE